MNDSNGEEYSDYISGFIIENKQSIDFRQQLNKIREGVVLYSGITYSSNSNLNELGSWNTELTVYLDTEILFHFIGYNGELPKALFNDFFQYVKEINSKSPNRLIKLKYFREVEDEIEKFFDKAKYILAKKDILRPNITAMISVLNGCKHPSDVLAKKSDFYCFLRTHDIRLEEAVECLDKSNYEFNIIDQGVIEKISKEFNFDIHDYLCLLNYVHIKRKHSNLNNLVVM
ncbi:hypothetical protein [Desulfobacter postgatei]|uniref:hypothetical protein n=1 Tax=Desulfobacter postgatei TaxID=2293 RepID=UPI00259B1D9B|nr:hypothetical protein [uncultured Desulfobacter sp.]